MNLFLRLESMLLITKPPAYSIYNTMEFEFVAENLFNLFIRSYLE